MYEFIDGVPVAYDAAGNLILNNVAAGVGYTLRTLRRDWDTGLSDMSRDSMEVRIFVRAKFSESIGYTLFGFADVNDRTAFDVLTTVKGVAGKGAMAILDCMLPAELAICIRGADAKGIAKAKGVGPKLASRIVMELIDKIDEISGSAPEAAANTDMQDAIDACVALGYKRADVTAIMHASKDCSSTSEYIRAAIKVL